MGNDYVGGIVGDQTGYYINVRNISIMNSDITGGTTSGGSYIGGVAGRVCGTLIEFMDVNEINVSGVNYVGGVFGVYSIDSLRNGRMNYIKINSSIINGSGIYLGGIGGNLSYVNGIYWTVNDAQIINHTVDTQYVGGIAGYLWGRIDYVQVENSEIESYGENIGGICGRFGNVQGNIRYGYIEGTTIHGQNYVGGILGYSGGIQISNIYVNAKITADVHSAGGVIGYVNNTNETSASNNRTLASRVLITDTIIKSDTKAGGLIGDIAQQVYRNQPYYNYNYIDADVTSTNASTGSLIIGGRSDENPYIKNTYVYKYSKLNGNYIYATNDNIDNEQYLVRADLDNQNTFAIKIGLGTTYWNYVPLSEGKYPKIKDEYLYQPELQTGVDLPVDPEITDISLLSESDIEKDNANDATTQNDTTAQSSIKTEKILSSYTVYPISVNEINIDFNKIINDYKIETNNNKTNEQQAEQNLENSTTLTNFTYFVNGKEQETVQLSNSTNQIYTFKYNFMDTIEIKLSNRQEEKTITITPEDVRREVSLAGNKAYLLGTSLYINGELQQGEYVNIYEGYALRSDGTVINIATGEIVESGEMDSSNNVNFSQTYLKQDKETYLEQTPKPLHTYDYKGNHIEVCGTYSKINGNIKLQVYNVRSGKLSALSNSLDMKIDNSITDNYNNKEYQTILNTSGELVDLKEMLKYPDNFLTRNIKQIVQNIDEEKTEVMVLYNTGKVIVFNYVSGEVVYENNEKADEGLTDYIAGSIENIWNDYEEKRQEYAKSKELEQKLAELPIEKAINTNGNGNTTNEITPTIDKDYITVYNSGTGKYEVYSENEILEGSDETPVSETEKIMQNGLEGIYGYNAKEEIKSQTNGAIIVIAIIVVAVIALVVLRKIVIKNNTKKKK